MNFGPEDPEDPIEELDGGETEQHEGDELDDADLDGADDESGLDDGDVDPAEPLPADANAPEEVAGRPKSRAQQRVETALREAREAKAELARFREEQERQKVEGRTAAEQERERLALENMDPYERLEYRQRQVEQKAEQRVAQLEFRMADAADRTDFASKCARTPALAAVADEVESTLAAMRQGGTTAPRETIATYLIGQRAISRAAGAKTRATKAGAARIAAAIARPSAARGDVRAESNRSDNAQARRKRLEDLQI